MRSKAAWWILTASSALCLCLAIGASVLAFDLLAWRQPSSIRTEIASATPTLAGGGLDPTESPPFPTPAPPRLSAEVRQMMDEIQAQVSLLRGLRASAPVTRTVLTAEELRQRVLNKLLEDYTQDEADDDVRLMVLLGLVSPGFDLWGFYADLYAEQIAGYYDQDTHEMVVVQGSQFDAMERLTYVHEYAHALQDQAFDFERGLELTDTMCEREMDRCAALRALIEGDASLVEAQWLRTYATPQDLAQLPDIARALESPVLLTAPTSLREDALFAYARGVDFARHLYLEGSWAAIDAAFADPPRSTEHILHPERFPEDLPVPLRLPDPAPSLGPRWRELARGVMGEWWTRLVLSARLPPEEATAGADGWGGDYYLAFHNDQTGQAAMAWLIHWDTLRQAEEAFLAFRSYTDARFGSHTSRETYVVTWDGGSAFVLLERESQQTVWILAPDEATAGALRQGLPFPAPLP